MQSIEANLFSSASAASTGPFGSVSHKLLPIYLQRFEFLWQVYVWMKEPLEIGKVSWGEIFDYGLEKGWHRREFDICTGFRNPIHAFNGGILVLGFRSI